VVRLVPFHEATLPLTKPLPVICIANAAVPAGTLAGDTEVMAGGAVAAGGFGLVLGGAEVLEPAGVPPPQPETRWMQKKRERRPADDRDARNRLWAINP
jgi:hypothetical protein